ncbi:MAG TPA: DUF2059 domain-containing protein [Caulobacteraceae bacterium]|nr:DUF2059 domain-containing protein [Caulobacteraceae bacterium]
MKSLAVAMGLACLFVGGAAQAAPTDKQLDLAKRYVAAAHMADGVNTMMKQLQPMLMNQASAQLTSDQKKILGDAFDVAYAHYLDHYMTRIVPILAETYSEDELAGIVAFYESPTGQAMIAKSPALQEKLVPVAMDLVPDLQADMKAEVCAHVSCEAPSKKPIS